MKFIKMKNKNVERQARKTNIKFQSRKGWVKEKDDWNIWKNEPLWLVF